MVGRRRVAIAAALTVSATLVGIAFAAWVAGGTGQGAAKAGAAQPLTVSGGTPTNLLYPGGTGDVAATITNPNPFPVRVTGISGNGAITSDKQGCDSPSHGVTFTNQTGTWDVPRNGNLGVVLAGAVTMSTDSPDACQGASFSMPLAVAGAAGSGAAPGPTTTTAPPTSTTLAACIDDQREPNDGPNAPTMSGTLNENATISVIGTACLNNADWFRLRFIDGGNCSLLSSQAWDVKATLAVSAGGGGSLEVSITDDTATPLTSSVTAAPGQTVINTLRINGTCGISDSRDLYFKVVTATGTDNHNYTLTLANQPL
jgi:hypothetical protein